MSAAVCLVLRLAAPLQSWGSTGRHVRRDTAPQPTKSGIVGLLAAADGRRRTDPIEDLVGLTLGVRTDQAGQLLRDYHTVSRLDGSRMPKAELSKSGKRQASSTGDTKVTERFYLADAVFTTAIGGPGDLLARLAQAINQPRYALSLGRRSCPPTMPLHVSHRDGQALWPGTVTDVLAAVPWQAGRSERGKAVRQGRPSVDLVTHVDDVDGLEVSQDVPATFHPKLRSMTSRRVTRSAVVIPTGVEAVTPSADPHDPFALLGA